MPAPLAADWTALRAMYVKGLPAKQIAAQTGISFAALRQRIKREAWDADVTKAEQAISRAVTCSLQDRAIEWVNEIDAFVRETLGVIKRRDKDTLAIKDLKTLIETAELADRMARRSYGLDDDRNKPHNNTLVSVTVNELPSGSGMDGAIIELGAMASAGIES